MNTELLKIVEKTFIKKVQKFNVGDTISVNTIVREGDKNRIQIFKGIVMAIKGSGLRQMFTIRKISSGVGVEKIFPMNSTNIESIEVHKKGDVRRAKLYYMRGRIGKRAMKINEKVFDKSEIEPESETIEEEVKEASTQESPEIIETKAE